LDLLSKQYPTHGKDRVSSYPRYGMPHALDEQGRTMVY
jgi:hypothetical protein